MKKFLMASAIACSFSTPAMATYYNATFDCGHGQIVWIGNPVKGPFGSPKRGRKVIFEIELSDFDFEKGPIRSPVIKWDVHKDEVTSDGQLCHEMTEDEVKELNKFEEGEDK
jgi:hypothetical protein